MNRTEVERLAKAANGLRPDWPWNSLVTFIETHLTDRAYRDVATAIAYVCADPETRTPKRVLEPGPWWNVGLAGQDRPTEPGIVTYCEHGQPGTTCPTCHPRTGTGATRTPEQRAAIQQAIADAKMHLATLATDKDQR